MVHQRYAQADAKRATSGRIVRIAMWVGVLIVLVVAGPPVYHAAGAAYYKHHLQSISEGAMRDCGGPFVDSMGPQKADEIKKCLDENQDLIKAKADYAKFSGTDKP